MRFRVSTLLLILVTLAFYLAGQGSNPPGFFADESSIAYNALTIARGGVDEHGNRFPLYFVAFGEYKNPVYVYLLAGVFKVLGPSDLIARRLSSLAGYAAALLMAALAWRMTRSRRIAALTLLAVICTPMLFEISRLAFEVALYPLATAALLWSVYSASRREEWTWRDAAAIGGSLVLLTYTYSIGRLLAPLLLAAIVIVFFSRRRIAWLGATAAVFIVLAAIPIAVYNRQHHGALTTRFQEVSYTGPLRGQPLALISAVEQHYVADILPLSLSLRGDPNARHHVPGSGGSILLATFVLAVAGAVIALRRDRDRFPIFLVAGTLLSVIPAALTNEQFHTLRLSPFPIFLIALSIPAVEHLPKRWLTAILLVGALQAVWFFFVFHRDGGKRGPFFDAGFEQVVRAAAATGKRPIYLDVGLFAKANALWYGARNGIDASQYVADGQPAPGSLVITDRYVPANAQVISNAGSCAVYVAP